MDRSFGGFLNFLGNLRKISLVTEPIYIHRDLLFSASLPALVMSGLIDDCHSSRSEEIAHCFDLHFPGDY